MYAHIYMLCVVPNMIGYVCDGSDGTGRSGSSGAVGFRSFSLFAAVPFCPLLRFVPGLFLDIWRV